MEVKTQSTLIFIAMVAVLSAPVWADNNLPEVHQQGNISYVSGGIGDEETAALKSMKHNYNLSIMNADKTGHYSGNARIVISNMQHEVLLDTPSGPIFYANLPNGSYTVDGYSNAQSKKENVTIASGKPIHIRFLWKQDANETVTH